MSATVIVRRVAEADFAQWLPLWEGYNRFYGRSGPTALPKPVIECTWQRFLDPNEPVFALVAESEGKLIGLAHFMYHRSTIAISNTCYMQDLFTDESARGKGVGRALIHAVYEEAKQAGAHRVYWQTHETNSTAMALYDRVADRSGFLVYKKQF